MDNTRERAQAAIYRQMADSIRVAHDIIPNSLAVVPCEAMDGVIQYMSLHGDDWIETNCCVTGVKR